MRILIYSSYVGDLKVLNDDIFFCFIYIYWVEKNCFGKERGIYGMLSKWIKLIVVFIIGKKR